MKAGVTYAKANAHFGMKINDQIFLFTISNIYYILIYYEEKV